MREGEGMKKQPEVTAVTRETLARAFWTHYQQKKIEHISIKEITHLAGYNRSTFYEHFPDIYAVLNYVEDTLLADMKEKVMQGLDSPDDNQALQTIADFYDSRGEYLTILLGENGDPHFVKKFKAAMKPALYAFFRLKEDDAYSAYLFEFAMSAMIGTISYWYQHKGDVSSNEIVALVRSMLSKGVLQEIRAHS